MLLYLFSTHFYTFYFRNSYYFRINDIFFFVILYFFYYFEWDLDDMDLNFFVERIGLGMGLVMEEKTRVDPS